MSHEPALPYTFEPITTERLILRPFTSNDVDDVYAYQSLEIVTRYELFDPRTRDQVVEKLGKYSTAETIAKEGDYFQLGMQLNDDTSRVIGDIFFSFKSIENSGAEIGWTLHPDFQGKGYASEGAGAVLELAFTTLNLHRVMAELDPRNAPSIALCKRLGMREEALHVKDLWFKGEWADTGIYAILRDEWMKR